VSFDHYFATYPNATNPGNEPAFTASPNTPSVNGLAAPAHPQSEQCAAISSGSHPGADLRSEPRLHGRAKAFDNGLMDKFVENTEGSAYNKAQYCPAGTTMGYFDGNTVTAMWNYAQNYAMSDNSYGMVFGPPPWRSGAYRW
jgi:phospholipase C